VNDDERTWATRQLSWAMSWAMSAVGVVVAVAFDCSMRRTTTTKMTDVVLSQLE
jgi:hypothetical protein